MIFFQTVWFTRYNTFKPHFGQLSQTLRTSARSVRRFYPIITAAQDVEAPTTTTLRPRAAAATATVVAGAWMAWAMAEDVSAGRHIIVILLLVECIESWYNSIVKHLFIPFVEWCIKMASTPPKQVKNIETKLCLCI